jgi:hypothetical protein
MINRFLHNHLYQAVLAIALGLLASTSFAAAGSSTQAKYYRYLNEEGVKVISVAIPPEYAQKGYEIITKNGQVLDVVAPAPTPENVAAELEKRARKRALAKEHENLIRRYSSVDDIFAARDRRLTHLNATISILRNNLVSLDKQSEDLVGKAAESERIGREVSKQILSNIEQIKAEITTSQASLKARESEQDAINKEYQRAADLFTLGPKAFEARASEAQTTSDVQNASEAQKAKAP